MEREAVPIERRAQLAIAHSRVHRHRPRPAIERHDRFHLAQREKWSALSAIPFKQCRVPSTLKCACVLTNSWICASEVADVMRLVLYS